jgi:hypothetical protein
MFFCPRAFRPHAGKFQKMKEMALNPHLLKLKGVIMNVSTVLDEIELLAGKMSNRPQCERSDRVHDYTTIRILIQELEELDAHTRESGIFSEQLQHLKQNCRILAGLSTEDSPPDTQAYSEVREALGALRNPDSVERKE